MGGLHRISETSFWVLVAVVSAFKLLLIKSYRSTDFEVHRNWLAITHSLPLRSWYYDETSEWTLDYPPFFAYFEWVLSNFAVYFDKEMLNVNHLNYDSPKTILFQKLTVILGDFVLAYSVKKIVDVVGKNEVSTRFCDVYVKYCILIFANGGLFILDHIHFQYNGFMYGILLLSITKILEEKYFQGAIIFAILLNLKHIYLYIAPAFGIYLFRKYCIEGSGIRLRLNFKNLRGLAVTVVSVFLISFGPFYRHIPQIVSRLFPFKRGLCHAYWAPNIWALYNTVDIAINFVLKRGKSALTTGLIGEVSLNVLPEIQPIHTFGLTLFFMMPTLLKILWKPSPANFLNGIILTAWTSFMFGYHVHEKAILNVIIPFAVISAAEPKLFFMTLVPGTFSLFPLLFTPFEIVLKLFICSLHIVLCFISLSPLNFNFLEKLYLVGFVPLYCIENIGPFILTRYPFLPLMLVSNYCFIGIFICYVGFYWRSLTSEYGKKLGLGLWPGSDFRNDFVIGDKSSVADGDMDMDIDSIYQQQLIIIPDTNIWIHCLDLIRELLDTKFQDYAYPIIVIPWMVLQELDVSGRAPGGPSRNAIHYIHSVLRTNHPRVKGQKASDAAVIHPDFDKRNPDDSILQCVQQHQKENSAVVLVTNDRNMLNKALVNKILAADSSCGTMGISDVLKTNASSSCAYSVPFASNKSPKVNTGMVSPPAGKYSDEQGISNIPNQKTTGAIKNTKRPYSLPMRSNDTKKQKDDGKFQVGPFSDVLDLIHQTLSHVIEIKMKEDYGDPGWIKALKIPPPWTLKSSIQVIIKHWIAVFTEVFGRRVGVAEKLLECIISYEHGLRDSSNKKEIIEQVLGLFAAGEFSMSDIVREDSKVNFCRKRLLEYNILDSS